MSEQSKCPFTGAGTPPKNPTGRGTSYRDWWPNNLNLKILSQHSSLVDPMDKKFNYAKEFKKLNLKALKKDLQDLLAKKNILSKEEYGKKMNSLRKKNMDYQTERRTAIDKITMQRAKAREALLKKLGCSCDWSRNRFTMD